MVLEIKLSNFYSIKDEICLDLRATNLKSRTAKDLSNNYFEINNEKVLKSAALFGANASGKSNIIKAIGFCVRMILNSHNHNEDSIFNFQPFKFEDYQNKPSTFYIRFIHENIEYEYYFELNRTKILKEKLYYSPKGRSTKVFERDETKDKTKKDKYKFGNQISRPLDVTENTSEKTLFISRASQMDRKIAKDVFNYFNSTFILGLISPNQINFEKLFNLYKDELITALKMADSDIIALEIKKELLPVAEFNYKIDQNMAAITSTQMKEKEAISIKSFHKQFPKITFDFFSEESEGTKVLFFMLLTLLDILHNNKIILIDEIEKSLHPDIVDYIVKLFNNSNHAQLIFATHSINLLSFSKFRKDQIYFCNKKKDGSTDFYSLFDFNDFRDTLDLSKAYLQGRFNAVPIIDDSSNSIEVIVNGQKTKNQ